LKPAGKPLARLTPLGPPRQPRSKAMSRDALKLLLDTHVALWSLLDSGRLNDAAAAAIITIRSIACSWRGRPWATRS